MKRMNRTLSLYCFFLLVSNLYSSLPGLPQPLTLKGNISSSQLNIVPQFNIYYQGTQTLNNDDGFFSFQLAGEKENKYSLLICKDFVQSFDSINTIKNLSINPAKPYKFYSFTKATIPVLQDKINQLQQENKPINMRSRLVDRQIERLEQTIVNVQMKNELYKKNYDLTHYTKKLAALKKTKARLTAQTQAIDKKVSTFKKKYQDLQNVTDPEKIGDFWLIKQKTLQKNNFVIPDNCVFVRMNPKLVQTIENWKFPLPKNMLSFPRIILKNNLETKNIKQKQSIERSSLKSKLYALDAQVFHEQRKEEQKSFDTKPEVNVTITR